MNKILLTTTLLLALVISASAQVPQQLNYQAVARNAAGTVLANQAVSVRFTILDGSVTGTNVYEETHAALTTNQFGLFTTTIGGGTVVSGTFSAINWATNPKYVKVELDPAGGNNYVDMGTTQLNAVPYALYAGNSPAGATGPTGAAGANGTNGATGPTGANGTNGTNGTNGATGPAGANGTNGAAGANGTAGATGPTGVPGTNGTNGAAGATGPTGVPGTNGAAGATGPIGPTGAAGATGAAGPTGTGTTGPTGAAGTNISFRAEGTPAQALAAGTNTQVTYASILVNNGNAFAGNQFTAPIAGVYHFDAAVQLSSPTTSNRYVLRIDINGSSKAIASATCTDYYVLAASTDVLLNAGDIVVVTMYCTVTGASVYPSTYSTYFDGHIVY
jgi:hypothetical protein